MILPQKPLKHVHDTCLYRVYTSVMVALSNASDATPSHLSAATATTGLSGGPIGAATCAHNLRMIVDCLTAVGERDFSDQLVVAGGCRQAAWHVERSQKDVMELVV